MKSVLTSRSLIVQALLAGILAGCSGLVCAQRRAPTMRQSAASPRFARVSYPVARQQQRPAPIERRPPSPPNAAPQQARGGAVGHMVGPGRIGNGPKGEHLAEWMNQHSNLTLQQQQQALEREPGFQELPGATQQRMRERLAQLNAMSPQQRQRVLQRNEAMEQLTPDQRSQVRGAMEQLGVLPPDQRRQVARSFRELRELPQNQRMAAMMGPRYSYMNPAQRTALLHLIQVEPMLPPDEQR
jgi:hypothetical protein